MVDSEAPITAAKAQKVARAAPGDMVIMRLPAMKMKASGAKISTHLSGVAYR